MLQGSHLFLKGRSENEIYMLILFQVERWLRLRRQSCLPSKLQKFQETGWRCLFYLSALFYFSTKKSNLIFSCWWLFYVSALFYGIFCLWEKPWFHSINHCWDGYPYHKVCSEKNQFLNRLQSRWSRMSGFTTWSNSLFMGLSQSGRILLWLQWSAIVIVDGLAGLALLTYFREFYCCKFIGCLLSLNII